MQHKPSNPDTLFETVLQELPSDYEELARTHGAFERGRKVKTVDQLFRIVLLYCGLDKTLREVAACFAILYQRITDSAVAERLTACGAWLKEMLKNMLSIRAEHLLSKTRRWIVCDASSIQGPGAKGTQYRLHLGIELRTLAFYRMLLTDKYVGESLSRFDLRKGDVAILDRGYCHHEAMVKAVQNGVELVMRFNRSTVRLENAEQNKLDLVELLKQRENKGIVSIEVFIAGSKKPQRVRGWLHACQLPENKSEEARRKYKRDLQKKGITASADSLYLCGWMVLFTTLKPEELDGNTALQLYRVRWQIELVFKRLKSLLNLDLLRAREKSPLAEVWLRGKMLHALLLDRKMREKVGSEWNNMEQSRQATPWRLLKLLKDELDSYITGSMYWNERDWTDALDVVCERKRKRKLQQIPARVASLSALSLDS